MHSAFIGVFLSVTTNLPTFFLSFSRTLFFLIFINSLRALGSRFFTSDGAIDIGMGCEVWQGYRQSVQQGWNRVLLNINIASSVFLRGMPVLEYLYKITEHDARINRGVLSEINRVKFTDEIKSMLQGVFCE